MRVCIGGCGAKYSDHLILILSCLHRVSPTFCKDLRKDVVRRLGDRIEPKLYYCANCFEYMYGATKLCFRDRRVLHVYFKNRFGFIQMACASEKEAREFSLVAYGIANHQKGDYRRFPKRLIKVVDDSKFDRVVLHKTLYLPETHEIKRYEWYNNKL